MVWETIGEQRIGANVPSGGNPVGNSYCLLPDRPSVGHFEHSRSRIKKLGQICEGKGRYNRFVSDVLHSLEFQVHLNLPLCYGGKKENAGNARNASDQIP